MATCSTCIDKIPNSFFVHSSLNEASVLVAIVSKMDTDIKKTLSLGDTVKLVRLFLTFKYAKRGKNTRNPVTTNFFHYLNIIPQQTSNILKVKNNK